MRKLELKEGWTLNRSAATDEIKAVVPGSVYTDLLREGKMADPFFKDNEDAALKLMEEDYEYVCRFRCPEEFLKEDAAELVCQGLDTLAELFLNGRAVGKADNMHRTWVYDIKEVLKEENELRILFRSPLKFIREAYAKAPTRGSEDAMPGFVHIRKAHCMFGWDWGAHLPDAGIFRPIFIRAFSKARLSEVEILQEHEGGRAALRLRPAVVYCGKEDAASLKAEIEIKAPDGKTTTALHALQEAPFSAEIENPRLWWPRGYGEQPLYGIKVTLKEGEEILDEWSARVGLRTLTVSTEKDEWGSEFAFTVNGTKIFSMGADYIPEDHLLGRVNRDTTRELIKKAAFANFNTLRVWGGGYYPDDWFFDLCDEYGILVWQDFMFACAMYDLTPEFEESIRAEFSDNIIRIRHHACLGLMCGNNEMELFTASRNWVTKDSEVRDYLVMYEYILPKMMKELAPQVFYWPASPSSGGSFDDPSAENRGDVHYWDVWHGSKPFTEYRKFYFRFVSEFGFQSFPAEKTVEAFTDDEEDKNIFSYIFERHQRNGAANGKIMNYMQQTYRYPTDFSVLIYASQLLQAQAIRYGVEHFRRYRGRCMGAVIWQLNDCWPVASWSSVDYCGRLKALHYYARRFFAPLMVSCEEEGELSVGVPLNQLPRQIPQSVRFCVANETMAASEVILFWEVRDAKGRILRQEREELRAEALSSCWTERVRLPELDRFREYVSYRIEKDGETVSEGTVLFTSPKYFRYEKPALSLTQKGDEITVSSDRYAGSVEIQNADEDLVLSDNYFDLNGGEKTVRILSGRAEGLKVKSVYDIR
ncbi:MAG: glycoside hydrolase family 2 protein [Lachnospiraceae bacterium]|nr:glycoside hydrolase family 2 protein [Lachnospiraceae bacterium]